MFRALFARLSVSLVIAFLLYPIALQAQFEDFGRISGDLQIDAQYYQKDSVIGAEDVPEDVLMNGYLNLLYERGNFTAGLRYESYVNPLLGFDPRFEGSGIPYRFASYNAGFIEATIGNFYEQFGSGMIFRSYEDRQLGFDNAIDGFKVKVRPVEGLTLTGLIGKQRAFFELGPGLVRGGDIDLDLSTVLQDEDGNSTMEFAGQPVNLQLGASIVSRFQEDRSSVYILPENVGSYAGRLGFGLGGFSLYAEYAHKINDPSSTDDYFFPGDTLSPLANPANFSYNTGNGIYVATEYSQKGLGISLSAKRVEKMDFRSDRASSGNVLNLNFLPPLSKTHTYRLVTLYPYATQPNGEIGVEADVVFNIPRGSGLGGKYGTDVTLNYARLHTLKVNPIDTFLYDVSFTGDDRRLFDDFNVEISRRWNKNVKSILAYYHITYNKDIIEGKNGYGLIYADIAVADVTFKLNSRHSIRTELQHAWSSQNDDAEVTDTGNWVFALLEYTIAPGWFFTLSDEYNYGNDDEDKRLHYYNASLAYVHQAHRVSLGYARQREGIVCVGGVCRNVPASSGLALSISSSF